MAGGCSGRGAARNAPLLRPRFRACASAEIAALRRLANASASRSTLLEASRILQADRGTFSILRRCQGGAPTEGDSGRTKQRAIRRGRCMKLVIERGELLRALGHVTSVVERRTTIPILSNVLLKASGQALQFKATDLEREVSEEAPADVSQPGAVTVPAHILHDIVRKLPDGAEVEIKRDAEKERLTLTLGAFALRPADAGAGGLSRSCRRRAQPQVRDRRQRPEAPDRQDALCHLHRGDALLPERHLSARGHARQGGDAARGGHRRPPPGAGRAAAAQGRRRHAGHHPAAQDGARAAPPDRGQRQAPSRSACRPPRCASRSAPSR